jgi:hypothetical protein
LHCPWANVDHEGPFSKAFRPIKQQMTHLMKRFILGKQKKTSANHAEDGLLAAENGDVADIYASSKVRNQETSKQINAMD